MIEKPPKHLRPTTKAWFSSVLAEYSLEPHHVRLLTLSAESWDRCCESREALAEHGLTFIDRYGSPRARPEAAIESQSRIAFARLCRELDLDVDPPVQGKRPPALPSNRRQHAH
jgi:phage terminase small subunit